MTELVLYVLARAQHGLAHEHSRAAGGRLKIERDDRGVAHHDADGFERDAQLARGDLGEDGARALTHVRSASEHGGAGVSMEPDDRVRGTHGGRSLDRDGQAATVAGGKRRVPADRGRRFPYGLRPLAVGRRVVGHKRLALAGQIAEPHLDPIEVQPASPIIHLRFVCPRDLGRAEAAKGGAGCGVRKERSHPDSRVRYAVWTAGEVIALGDDPLRDVRIRAHQEVALDVLERDRAIVVEPGAGVDLARGPPHLLERLLE